MKRILFTIILTALFGNLTGQNIAKPDTTAYDNRRQTSKINLRLQYSSDWVYAGRKDSLVAPYLTPSILYAHHSGFFVKGFLSYLTNENRIDVWGVGAGYRMHKKNIYWGIGGELRLFNDSSYAIQSAVTSVAYTYLGYDLPWLETTVDINGFFGDVGDVLVGLELGKTFYLNDNKLSLYPFVYGLWGTQQYYGEYFTYKSTSQRKKQGQGGVNLPSIITYTTVEESTKFKFLSIDLGLSIRYKLNNMNIYFMPSYAIPFNPSTFKTDNTISQENLKNTFYYNVGISFLL